MKTTFKRLIRICRVVVLYSFTSNALGDVNVALTTPANGSTVDAPISLTATASATQGYVVSEIEFFDGTTLIGTDTASPYSVTWSDPSPGTHNLTAKATATKGSSSQIATSSVATITVNAPPSVVLTSPEQDETFVNLPPPPITLTAEASDDESIAQVEFWGMDPNGGQIIIATLTAPPYTYSWTIPAPYYYGGDRPRHGPSEQSLRIIAEKLHGLWTDSSVTT